MNSSIATFVEVSICIIMLSIIVTGWCFLFKLLWDCFLAGWWFTITGNRRRCRKVWEATVERLDRTMGIIPSALVSVEDSNSNDGEESKDPINVPGIYVATGYLYGDATLGYDVIGVFEDTLDRVICMCREYNRHRGGKYPTVRITKVGMNKANSIDSGYTFVKEYSMEEDNYDHGSSDGLLRDDYRGSLQSVISSTTKDVQTDNIVQPISCDIGNLVYIYRGGVKEYSTLYGISSGSTEDICKTLYEFNKKCGDKYPIIEIVPISVNTDIRGDVGTFYQVGFMPIPGLKYECGSPNNEVDVIDYYSTVPHKT